MPSRDQDPAAASASASAVTNVNEDLRNGDEDNVDDALNAQVVSGTRDEASTGQTQEPLLQHLFEDLKQRPADQVVHPSIVETHFDQTVSLDLGAHGEQ